jgi:hypothetical protein
MKVRHQARRPRWDVDDILFAVFVVCVTLALACGQIVKLIERLERMGVIK